MKKNVLIIIGIIIGVSVILIILGQLIPSSKVTQNINSSKTSIKSDGAKAYDFIGSCSRINIVQETLEGCTEYWKEKIGGKKCYFSDSEYYKYKWSTDKCPTENLADMCKIQYVRNPNVQYTLFIYKTDYLSGNSVKTTCDSLQSSQNQGTVIAEYIPIGEL